MRSTGAPTTARRFGSPRAAVSGAVALASVRCHRFVAGRLVPDRYCDADPFKVVAVRPQDVRWQQSTMTAAPGICLDGRGRFDKWKNAGRVAAGDWDRAVSPLWERPRYHLLLERFVAGKAWEETDFVRSAIEGVRRGEMRWRGCRTEQDIWRCCAEIDELYDSMRRLGYSEAAEPPTGWRGRLDILTLNIGRDGELIRNSSGGHRVCIAAILGLPSVPARVLVRHSQWHERRRACRGGEGVPAEHPLHADLLDVAGAVAAGAAPAGAPPQKLAP